MAQTINIARDFSRFPGGRYKGDGPFSGEGFRENILVPALAKGPVCVELDGTLGYGSSFLEEAFGGLVREHGYDPSELLNRMTIVTSNPSLSATVKLYIQDAKELAVS